MSEHFHKFQEAILRQFSVMKEYDLFRIDASGDDLWRVYLSSFPEGTNPMFRKRTEHDCSCCRQFIRTFGNVVAIKDGGIRSIWDLIVGVSEYDAVAKSLTRLIKSKRIVEPFLHYEYKIGNHVTYEKKDGEAVRSWNHFFVELPYRPNQGKNYFCEKARIPTKLGEARAQHDVLLRSLKEFRMEDVDTVLELMAQNSLYRGSEYREIVQKFRGYKEVFDKLRDENRQDIFVWSSIQEAGVVVSKIRNTAIGTLLIDLAEDMDLEKAVRRYEAVMAPQNYKRPTALVTKAMVERAKKQIEELGLTDALERRFARLSDISVNDIIFVNRQVKPKLADHPFDNLPTKKTTTRSLDNVEQIAIDQFIREIVPRVDKIEVMFENKHRGNLVSLIAPKHPMQTPLFKWQNEFSWAYVGDVTDSIKERVKKAGGNVTGDVCCRLAWYNRDDLDFHMREQNYEIYFANRRNLSPNGGTLDVDMNISGETREPVENIFYKSRHQMSPGTYILFVHQYRKRENEDVGFDVEIDILGDIHKFSYTKPVRQGERIEVARIHYREGKFTVVSTLSSSSVSQERWGIKTGEFHNVSILMNSPNHWEHAEKIGNKHYFFMLENCKNDEPTRGFYNEFLRNDLTEHRKVLEIVGGKMKVEQSDFQLSGLGFSDTKRDEITVRVGGTFTRTLKVLI